MKFLTLADVPGDPKPHHVERVRSWEEVKKKSTDEKPDGVIASEAEFAKLKTLPYFCPIMVISNAKTNTEGCFYIPEAFWASQPGQALGLFVQYIGTHRQMMSFKLTLDSLSESHSELADSSESLIQKLESNIQLAAEIQRSLLPSRLPQIPGISLAARFFASHGVGGDYYDIFEFGDKKHFGFLLADSETHGMAAALLSTLLKVRTEQIRKDFSSPADFLQELSTQIQFEIPTRHADLHLLYGVLNRSSLQFSFVTAGDLVPMLWRRGKQVALKTKAVEPICSAPIKNPALNVWSLEPSDYLVLVSGGINKLLSQTPVSDWIGTFIAKHEQWPDLLDIQNEVAAIAHPPENLHDDVTLIQLNINAKTLYIKSA